MLNNIPHTPWFIRPEPTSDGQAVIENGTSEGSHIAVAEWHVAEFIVATVNLAHQAPESPAGPDPVKAGSMTPEERLNRVRSALFPTLEDMGKNMWADQSADENLDSAIIDLEMRGTDKVCIGTLKRVYWQLAAARKAIEST